MELELIRGTTPTIEINVVDELDISQITDIWVYISQLGNLVIDKGFADVTIDAGEGKIILTLSQEDTLALQADIYTLVQVRALLQNGTAIASEAQKVIVREVYKDGIIGEEQDDD